MKNGRESGHWNYRVLKNIVTTSAGEDEHYQMIECYYDRYGRITSWSPTTPGGSTVTELESDLRQMTLVAGLANLKNEQRRFLTMADLPVESG